MNKPDVDFQVFFLCARGKIVWKSTYITYGSLSIHWGVKCMVTKKIHLLSALISSCSKFDQLKLNNVMSCA